MVRLFLDHLLAEGEPAPLSREQVHYLSTVMRLRPGDGCEVFDGQSGSYEAEIVELGKRGGLVRVGARVAPLRLPPDLWLYFAPVKKARTDFIVEKAVEMGAARICPVVTERTRSERFRRERLQAHAVAAAEQCRANFVPEVAEVRRLGEVLDGWPADRRLMFCDEALAGSESGLPEVSAPWAIVVGPEGGFSHSERARLRGMAHGVSLGPRILRADTAVVAAMALWQLMVGEWR